MIMKKILLVLMLAGCLVGLSQANVLADSITVNQVLYDPAGQPYTGTVGGETVNTLAVALNVVTNIGGLDGFCIDSQGFGGLPAVYDKSAVDNNNEYKTAYIAEKYFGGGFNALGSAKDVEAAAQYAIWQLIPGNSTFAASWTSLSQGMIDEAAIAVGAGYKGTDWFILTNEINQDVIVRIPEPTTILLIGIGMVGLAGFARKRFKS
jgi:hypothetical protein